MKRTMIILKNNILTMMLLMLLLMTIGHINVIAATPLTNLTGTVANLNFHKQLTAINQWKYFEDGSGKAQYPNNFEAFWDVTRSNIECGFVIEFLSIRYLPPGDVLEIGFEDYFDTEPKVGPWYDFKSDPMKVHFKTDAIHRDSGFRARYRQFCPDQYVFGVNYRIVRSTPEWKYLDDGSRGGPLLPNLDLNWAIKPTKKSCHVIFEFTSIDIGADALLEYNSMGGDDENIVVMEPAIVGPISITYKYPYEDKREVVLHLVTPHFPTGGGFSMRHKQVCGNPAPLFNFKLKATGNWQFTQDKFARVKHSTGMSESWRINPANGGDCKVTIEVTYIDPSFAGDVLVKTGHGFDDWFKAYEGDQFTAHPFSNFLEVKLTSDSAVHDQTAVKFRYRQVC